MCVSFRLPLVRFPRWSPLPSPAMFALSDGEHAVSEIPEVKLFNKLHVDRILLYFFLFALILIGVFGLKGMEILRSASSLALVTPWFSPTVALCSPSNFFLNKFPCTCFKSSSTSEFSSTNLHRHDLCCALLDARIWEQTGCRREHVFPTFLWLFPPSLSLKFLPHIVYNSGEPVSLDLLVSRHPCSSSTSFSGGPFLGPGIRDASYKQFGTASTIHWCHLPMKGALGWPSEHGVHLMFWLRRRPLPPFSEETFLPMVLPRRWQPLQSFVGGVFCKGRRGRFLEDAWMARLVVVAARVRGSHTWRSSFVDYLHVYLKDLDVIFYFVLVQNVTRVVICYGDPAPQF